MMAQGIVGRVGAFTWSAGASSCEGQAWRRAHHSERERGGNAAAARQRDDGSALWCGGAGGKPGGGGGSADLRLRWRRRVRFFFHFQRIFE